MLNATPLGPVALPVIAAPMFLVSGPELVIAACRAGIIGSFPAANARTPEILGEWLARIRDALDGRDSAGFAVNVNVKPGRYRDFGAVMDVLEEVRVPLLITSVGDPAEVARRVHGWGGKVLHDVTTVRHAQKALEGGVDGLILVCAGAGGHAGSASPFSFLRAVRQFYDGLVVLGGGIADGYGLGAALALGADFVYMGTRFLASRESMAPDDYKQSLIDAGLPDIIYTDAISGIPANFLKPSILAAGMDPENLPKPDANGRPRLPEGKKAWKDIRSAGQGCALIGEILPCDEIVKNIAKEFNLSVNLLNAACSRRTDL